MSLFSHPEAFLKGNCMDRGGNTCYIRVAGRWGLRFPEGSAGSPARPVPGTSRPGGAPAGPPRPGPRFSAVPAAAASC